MAEGHAVRGTSRDSSHVPALEAAGVEAFVGDPDRVGTIVPALQQVSVACLLLGSAVGDPDRIAALHGPRLEMLLEKMIDTTVRGIVYEAGGTAAVTLLASELPVHTHAATGVESAGTQQAPTNGVWAEIRGLPYAPGPPNAALSPLAIAPMGGNQPHNNMQPYLTINFCIALQGVYPPRTEHPLKQSVPGASQRLPPASNTGDGRSRSLSFKSCNDFAQGFPHLRHAIIRSCELWKPAMKMGCSGLRSGWNCERANGQSDRSPAG